MDIKINSTNFDIIKKHIEALKELKSAIKHNGLKELNIRKDLSQISKEITMYDKLIKEYENRNNDVIQVGKYYTYADTYENGKPRAIHFIKIKSKNLKRFIIDKISFSTTHQSVYEEIINDADILQSILIDSFYNDKFQEITEDRYNLINQSIIMRHNAVSQLINTLS